jgi:hypothetical protein
MIKELHHRLLLTNILIIYLVPDDEPSTTHEVSRVYYSIIWVVSFFLIVRYMTSRVVICYFISFKFNIVWDRTKSNKNLFSKIRYCDSAPPLFKTNQHGTVAPLRRCLKLINMVLQLCPAIVDFYLKLQISLSHVFL